MQELVQTYETAIPEMAAEIRRLRGELREKHREGNKDQESSGSTTGYDDLSELAKRLGLDQQQ